MTVDWPQLIYLMLFAAGFTFTAIKHGEPKEGRYHIGHSVAAGAICLGLLYWGGFF